MGIRRIEPKITGSAVTNDTCDAVNEISSRILGIREDKITHTMNPMTRLNVCRFS